MVWGDGKKIERQVISATDLGAFGTKHFAIPFDATGKSWVRFAVWDSAGNGAFVQPVWLNATRATTDRPLSARSSPAALHGCQAPRSGVHSAISWSSTSGSGGFVRW